LFANFFTVPEAQIKKTNADRLGGFKRFGLHKALEGPSKLNSMHCQRGIATLNIEKSLKNANRTSCQLGWRGIKKKKWRQRYAQ